MISWRIRYMLKLPWLYLCEVYYWLVGRPKGRIAKVGTLTTETDGAFRFDGWHFDASSCNACIDASIIGKTYVAGYTLEELKAIAACAAASLTEG